MNAYISIPHYSLREDFANSIIHGAGFILSIIGICVLIAFASIYGNAWHVVSCSIYGSTLVFLYTASTLYHSIQLTNAKRVLRVLDHSTIFLLIAGTYTPFTLVNLRGPWGWSLFGVIMNKNCPNEIIFDHGTGYGLIFFLQLVNGKFYIIVF